MAGMYKMKSIHCYEEILLPKCMYSMGNFHTNGSMTSSKSYTPVQVQQILDRQHSIIKRLEAIKAKIDSNLSTAASGTADHCQVVKTPNLPKDIVIFCNPNVKAFGIISLLSKLKKESNVMLAEYVHSSASGVLHQKLSKYGFERNLLGVSRSPQCVITWIWKDCADCEMAVNPLQHTKVIGEVNICRYLMKVAGYYPSESSATTVVDHWLDTGSSLLNGTSGERAEALGLLAKRLAKQPYITGSLNCVDVVLYSAFIRSVTADKWLREPSIVKWQDSLQSLLVSP